MWLTSLAATLIMLTPHWLGPCCVPLPCRLGVRLNGPRPTWTRTDGGEGGSHPSNVHDHTYAIGAVNFTGDMPVILMVDGPSLGGFVCAATIVSTELWKIGQVGKPIVCVQCASHTPHAMLQPTARSAM